MSANSMEKSAGPPPGDARRDLTPWLWLGFPPVIILAQLALKFDEELFQAVMKTEQGVVENGTVVLSLIASVLAVVAARRFRAQGSGHRGMRAWLYFFAFAAFVFAGEEASWGQHWFHWSTPETWAAVNPRGETSLHNAAGAFDQLPRTILTVGSLLGGLILPLVFLLKKKDAAGGRGFWYWAVPTIVCAPTVVLAMIVTLPKKYYESYLDTEVPRVIAISPGETKEFLLALFFVLYVASILHRQKARGLEGRTA